MACGLRWAEHILTIYRKGSDSQLVFELPDGSHFAKLLSEEPVIAPDLPPRIDAAVRGCLVKERARRFSAEQVRAALDAPRGVVQGAGGAPVGPRVPAAGDEVQVPPPAAGEIDPNAAPPTPRRRTAPGRPSRPSPGDAPPLPGPPRRTGPSPVLEAARWVRVSAGSFRMGSPEAGFFRRGDPEAFPSEYPAHDAIITRSFFLKVTPVTQAEWRDVMGTSPSRFQGDDLPVETVSWDHAVHFCNELSVRAGLPEAYVLRPDVVQWHGLAHPGYRLPTEAEWEYACRAGTTTPRYGDLDDIAWYAANSAGSTRPVGQKRPNAWGFHDMLGNVWEWCWDWWSADHRRAGSQDPTGATGSSFRVNRGGSWGNVPRFVRAAFRYGVAPGSRGGDLGFRLARSGP